MDALYGAALRLAWVASIPYQIVMELFAGRPAARRRERLGRSPEFSRAAPGCLWVHAVSFGEVRLAHAVIAALRVRLGNVPILLTTLTETGRALAERQRRDGGPGAADAIAAPPIDLPGPIGRVLDAARPRALVLVETELWPNLLRLGPARGVPVLVVNGRLSPRGFARILKVRRLFAPGVGAIRCVAAQTDADARRFAALGAPSDRVRVTGNIKFDLPIPAPGALPSGLRLQGGPEAPIVVAGSTARGEAEPVARAFLRLRQARPAAVLLIAPRHPEDIAATRHALEQAGLGVEMWSRLGGDGSPTSMKKAASSTSGVPSAGLPAFDAVVVDTMGVLPSLYPLATVAFVGGSLVPRGGQNLLEPAACGVPVLFGPFVDTVRFAADALVASGGGFQVSDTVALGDEFVRLATDEAARARAGERARETVLLNRGALARTVDLVAAALVPPAARGASG